MEYKKGEQEIGAKKSNKYDRVTLLIPTKLLWTTWIPICPYQIDSKLLFLFAYFEFVSISNWITRAHFVV